MGHNQSFICNDEQPTDFSGLFQDYYKLKNQVIEEAAKEVFLVTLDWDDHDTVHAEEYFQEVDCLEED